MKTQLKLSFALAFIVLASNAFAFCGFYVAKADVKLFNTTSQVILARDGDRTVVTMASDFQGDVKDFAMVVPVPEVLKRQNIRVAKQSIFDKLDTYTAPRVVEYNDPEPCRKIFKELYSRALIGNAMAEPTYFMDSMVEEEYAVTIEAQYEVEEYNILILSAKESNGLKRWLLDNGYQIPADAEEVLDPYINDGLKFFVVKVDAEKFKATGSENLRPLQIAYQSSRFMLPIRLGMANANPDAPRDQDMIVYAFTRNGRVETANYRTAKLPTDRDVPEFIQDQFGQFYVSVVDRHWQAQGGKSVVLEYAWDVSGNNGVKCDPCPTTPMSYTEMREAGVNWISPAGGASYSGPAFITRLHVRYNRKNYPQDLAFMETPNKERFQGRYVVRHPAAGDLECDQGQIYLQGLVERRQNELDELAKLTGWDIEQYDEYVAEYRSMIGGGQWIESDFDNTEQNEFLPFLPGNGNPPSAWWLLAIGVAFALPQLVFRRPRNTAPSLGLA